MRKIKFKDFPLMENVGVKSKTYTGEEYKIRIVEFTDEFVEEDWCKKGHVGLVLEGSMKIEFENETLLFEKGDGIYIDSSGSDKHKAIIEEGGRVKLVLFDEV